MKQKFFLGYQANWKCPSQRIFWFIIQMKEKLYPIDKIWIKVIWKHYRSYQNTRWKASKIGAPPPTAQTPGPIFLIFRRETPHANTFGHTNAILEFCHRSRDIGTFGSFWGVSIGVQKLSIIGSYLGSEDEIKNSPRCVRKYSQEGSLTKKWANSAQAFGL